MMLHRALKWLQQRQSEFKLTGELCGVYFEGENWPRYNGTTLYCDVSGIGTNLTWILWGIHIKTWIPNRPHLIIHFRLWMAFSQYQNKRTYFLEQRNKNERSPGRLFQITGFPQKSQEKFHDFSMTSQGQHPNFQTKNNICFLQPCINL